MNAKRLAGLAIIAALVTTTALVGRSEALRKTISHPRTVQIDGRSYVSDDSDADDRSLIRRELDRMGVPVPEGLDLEDLGGPSHPLFSERLKGSDRSAPAVNTHVPAGLEPEHSIRTTADGTSVELVFGSMSVKGPSIRRRLLTCGWESAPAGGDSSPVRVLRNPHGKESGIVCLDEGEGTFLLFREVGK